MLGLPITENVNSKYANLFTDCKNTANNSITNFCQMSIIATVTIYNFNQASLQDFRYKHKLQFSDTTLRKNDENKDILSKNVTSGEYLVHYIKTHEFHQKFKLREKSLSVRIDHNKLRYIKEKNIQTLHINITLNTNENGIDRYCPYFGYYIVDGGITTRQRAQGHRTYKVGIASKP